VTKTVVHVSRTGRDRQHFNTLGARVEILIDFHYLLDGEHTKDDTITLVTDDDDGASYRRTYVLSNSEFVTKIEDQFLRARFTQILAGRSYGLKIDPGIGPDGRKIEPYLIFNGVILPPKDPKEATLRPDIDYAGGDELATEPPAPRGTRRDPIGTYGVLPLPPVETVKGVQARLKALGYNCGPIDGIYGPKTRAAAKVFQTDYGLVVDGIVGPITRAALIEANGS